MLTKKIGKAPKGRKHKKIKAIDPFYHGERKNIYDKKLLNKAPRDDDDSQFPGKLREILRLKEELKNKKQKKSERSDSERPASISKNKYIPVPSAETFWPKPEKRASKTDESNQNGGVKPLYVPEGQKDNETAVAYLRRTNEELSDVFEKTVLFKKYGIDFTDMNSGKMEKLYGMNDKKRNRLKEIAKEKKRRKLEKKNDSQSGFEHLTDNVDFGEVAMSPPEKLAKPRHADSTTLSKPGKKELLLKNVIKENSKGPTAPLPKTATKKDKYTLTKTVKLKHLPPVKQTMLNAERERVVQLYKEMKKKNRENNK
ncbi:unnamed protein product [Acanthosepion pharaonis]|uniref:Coiled-coil domain-containing protein 137 n=1 Tax=Acanthosepion pharaonis TaxID=158019 RepID=A0A812EMP0_ACAPH|nr:unnamed protein product [Sepia pharaonis]